MMQSANPISSKERSLILDALRGLALLGICLANYPEFSLYTFQDEATRSAMPTYGIDRVVRFMQYFLIDGKFYTIFSLLFGIGFSIILANAQRKHANGLTVFYRRMAVLAVIGAIHLMLIWSGDILLLYALLGMVLPLFLKWSDKRLLPLALLLVIIPTAIDTYVWISGANLSAYAIAWQQHFCGIYGITDDNFGVWLRDADNYGKVLQFLVQGACVRVQEMTDGHRAFKVMAFFLLAITLGVTGYMPVWKSASNGWKEYANGAP